MATSEFRAMQLERLAAKYRWLAALRTRREEAAGLGLEGFSGVEAQARREAFRALAREFPGSLRELDTSPLEVLQLRAEAVEEELRAGGRESLPLWMELILAYHTHLRETLAIKHWLARRLPRRGAVDARLAAEFEAWYAELPFRSRREGTLDVAELQRHLHPPRGRIQELVWEALELRYGRLRAELETLIFGSMPAGR